MSQSSKEIKDLIAFLNNAETWDDSAIDSLAESLFRKAFRASIRSVHRSSMLLAYHLDIKKDLDPVLRECLIFLVRPGGELKPKVLENLIEDMREAMAKEGLLQSPHLMFFFGGNEDQKEYIKDTFPGSSFSDSKDLEDLLHMTMPRREIVFRLRRRSIDIAKCPFHYLGPCSPELFVGRAKIINDILLGAQNGYAVAGGRRIGKTSLLLKIQSEIKKGNYSRKKYHPLYIDCSNFSTFQALVNDISRRLFPHYYDDGKKSRYLWTFDKILGRKKGLEGKTLLLLLDEMDPLVKKAKEKDEDTNSFFNSLRSESNKDKLRLVITGFRRISDMIKDIDHPFYNVCEGISLGVLSQDEVRQLVTRPLVRIGIKLEPEDKIVSRIYGFTSGHPSVVQFIAKQLFRKREGDKITDNSMEKVFKDKVLIEFMLDNFVMNTSPLERLISLLVIKEKSFDMETLQKIIDQEGIKLDDSSREIYKILRNLTFNNIMVHEQGVYRFITSVMQFIIRERFYSPYLIESLKREVQDGQ